MRTELIFTDEEIDRITEKIVNKLNKAKNYDGIMQGLNEAVTYEQLYKELTQFSKELLPYYSIDKVKWYSVAVWDKEDLGKNLFDITAYEIYFWDGYNVNMISNEAMLIVEKIQIKLREIQFFFHRENHKEYYE